MADFLEFSPVQDLAGMQSVPVIFRWLEAGGVGDPSQPGQWTPFSAGPDGAVHVALLGPSGSIMLADDADGVAETAVLERIPTVARLYAFNEGAGSFSRIRTDADDVEESSPDGLPALRVMGRNRLFSDSLDAWSREHAQDGFSVAASAARTVATTFGNFVNVNHRALHIIVGVTVIGADGLVIDIEARELNPPFSFYPLLTSAAITSTGVTVLKIGIGFTPVPDLTANNMIPAVWRVVATPAGADPITYSINANLSV